MESEAVTAPHRPAPDPHPVLGALGGALVVGGAAVVAVGLLAALAGWRVLASPWASRGMLVGVAVVVAVAWWWLARPGRRTFGPSPGPTRGRRWVAGVVVALPALVHVAVAAVARALPAGRRLEWFLGGDNTRHVVMTAREQAEGYLTYGVQPYPRAWHTALAATWSALGLTPDRDVVGVLDVSALAVWLLAAVLVLTTATLAATVGRRAGLGALAAAGAGALAGAVLLWPELIASYQALGLEASVVAACVLAVVLRSQLVEGASARGLLVAAASVVVLAHTWQLLLPVAGLAAVRSGLALLRRRRAADAVLVVGAALATAVLAWPGLAAVATKVGVEHARAADVVAPVPWALLALGAVAAVALSVRRDGGLRWVLALALLPALTGLALAARVGVAPDSYYPSKLLWETAALGLAPLATGVGLVLARLAGRTGAVAATARVLTGGVVGLSVVYGVLGPVSAFAGAWSTTDGATVLRLLAAPGASGAQVVHSGGPLVTDAVTRILLDALTPGDQGSTRPQESLTVEQECALLAATASPTVLSDEPADAVRARYACAPDVRVVAPR